MEPNVSDSAHKSRWKIGEVVFGIPFLISLALQLVLPYPLSQGIFRQVLLPVGLALMMVGIGFIVLARREFSRHRQPTDPGQPTSQLIRSGVFTISRNPLYLGASIFLIGIALTFNLLWSVVTLLPCMVLCHYILILPEEQYLAGKFGDEYRAYFASVHRWLGPR